MGNTKQNYIWFIKLVESHSIRGWQCVYGNECLNAKPSHFKKSSPDINTKPPLNATLIQSLTSYIKSHAEETDRLARGKSQSRLSVDVANCTVASCTGRWEPTQTGLQRGDRNKVALRVVRQVRLVSRLKREGM